MNEFDSASQLLLMFTEDTKRWIEMMNMAKEEFQYLYSTSAVNEFGKKIKILLSKKIYMEYLDGYTTLERDKMKISIGGGYSSVTTLPMHYPLPSLSYQSNNSTTSPYHLAQQQQSFSSIAHRKSHSMDSQVMAANAKKDLCQTCITVGSGGSVLPTASSR